MADKLIIDCTTGGEQTEPVTAEEQAERDALAAQAVQERQQAAVVETNETAINDRLDQAITALKGHVDQAKPSTAAAQASAAYDATVLLCRVAIGVIRLIRRRLDAAE